MATKLMQTLAAAMAVAALMLSGQIAHATTAMGEPTDISPTR